MRRLRLFLACLGRRSASTPAAGPPLGILSLAAYLRTRFELDIRLIDQRARNLSLDALAKSAIDFRPDVVGMTVLTPFAHMVGPLTRRIRAAMPGALIVLGGPHVTGVREQALADTDADAAIPGEGERTFEQLIALHFEGESLESAPGLIWRNGPDSVVTNPGDAPVVEDLDTLPFPAYDLIDVEPYARLERMSQVARGPHRVIFTSRGCPYRCIYCHHTFGKRFRAQSAARVVEEIAYCAEHSGVHDIEVLDDVFNFDPARVIEFAQLARKRCPNLRIDFANGLRSDTLTEEAVEALVDAGMHRTSFGLESGSPRIQGLIGKHLDVAKFLRAVEWTSRRRVFTHGFTMLGFPSETEADLMATVDTACASRLHTAAFFTVVPYPGTGLYRLAVERRPDVMDSLHYDDSDYASLRLNLSELPDAVFFKRKREAWRRFYGSPRRLARIARDYPNPWTLPRLIPTFLRRATNGLGVTRDE